MLANFANPITSKQGQVQSSTEPLPEVKLCSTGPQQLGTSWTQLIISFGHSSQRSPIPYQTLFRSYYEMTLKIKSLSQPQVRGSVLFRQYYPEGGWGWVVVFVGALMIAFTQVWNICSSVHIYPTSQGIHLSFGVLVKPAVWRFRWLLVFSQLAELLKNLFTGPPSSPMSRLPPSPWLCQGNAFVLFCLLFPQSCYIPGFCLCLWLPSVSTNRPGFTPFFLWSGKPSFEKK